MSNDSGNVEYHYDNLSRIDWEKHHFNGLSQDYYIYYQYNLAGQVKEVRDPFNDVIYYNYDKAGQITSVTGSDYAGVTQYTSTQTDSLVKYRSWGAIKQLTYGNGFKTDVGYDASMRASSFEINGQAPQYGPPLAVQAENQYYADGRLRFSKDNVDPRFDRAFEYDHIGRVNEAYTGVEARTFVNQPRPGNDTQGPSRQSPRFDHWGNLTSDTARFWSQNVSALHNFEATTGRLLEFGWDYDTAGNLLTHHKSIANGVTRHTYKYDARNLNVEVNAREEVPDALRFLITSYSYDGAGRAVKQNVLKYIEPTAYAPRVTYYIYSAALGGALLTEITSLGDKKKGYVWAGGMLLAEQRADRAVDTAPPLITSIGNTSIR